MKNNLILITLAVCSLFGCATTKSLPSHSAEVDSFKKAEWPQTKRSACAVLNGKTPEQIFKMAKSSLTSNKFQILKDDVSKGVLVGNHRMTWTYWNAMVGVYTTKVPQGVQVDVLAVSDGDPRPIRLSRFDWHEKILSSIVSQSSFGTEACSK